MHALFWDGRDLKLNRSYPTPDADNRTALVKVRLAGICSTDLQILKGYMGFHGVPGHEFIGEVKEGPKETLGKRVVGEINFTCGGCAFCMQGLGRHCPERSVMGILRADGCFAEYVAVPAVNLHPVSDNLSDEEAVFVEPLAAAFEILEQVHVNSNDKVLVLGDGKLGLLCAQVLRLTGAQVTVVGRHEKKLSFIKGLGLQGILLPDWRLSLMDVVVEATGSLPGMKMAMEAVRPRGTLVLKSTVAESHSLSLAPLVINEVTVVGSRCGPFAPALAALVKKDVTVKPMIEKTYPLGDGPEAIHHAVRPGTMKILLGN